ncbi:MULTISPECIES: hypothetical protein [unclassified Caulobacter]|uniref:hypothetical protein n=1 Tax=unclassified Caulobacter TaxID=2648921 RepID=UPI000781739A|nr:MULTISPECIES: hypothetical protein [unclassified Caulobacter]AZS20548.1 hypothetical protein CSW63_07745 [Caulobacter sp. FWC26]
MATFSVTEAATAGFGVIGRKPLAVVGWALALAIGMIIPAILGFLALGPQVQQMMQMAMTQKEGAPDPEFMRQMLQAQSGMTAANLLFWLWSTFLKAVFCAAVFRAVLTPKASSWAYLRLGSREMWLTLLLLVEQVLIMIVAFVVALVIAVLAAVAGVSGGENGAMAAVTTAFAGAAVAIAVLVWLALRLSMAAPMTFADNQFRLFESWALTKGQGWRLLGVALLVVVFVIGVEILIGAVLLGTVFAAGGSLAALHGEAGFEAFMARPPLTILRDVWPWVAVIGVIGALFSAVVQAIFYAPWAAVHRALTSEA